MKGLLISNVNKVYQGIYVLKCDYPDYFPDNPDYFPDNPDYYTNSSRVIPILKNDYLML